MPAAMPYISGSNIFSAVQTTQLVTPVKNGEYALSVVNDQSIPDVKWIKAEFTASGQSATISLDQNWSTYIANPSKYALRFITLGAGNTYAVVIRDKNGNELRFPIAGDGGLLGGVSSNNQTAIADFSWLASKAPAGFDWSSISAFKIESTTAGWVMLTDIKVVGLAQDYDVAMGVAGHDLQGSGWRQRLGNYQSYFGQTPATGTYFTTIFDPIHETQDTNDHYSDIISRAQALSDLGTTPIVTLEFRSWAQIANDQAMIANERARFNAANAGGISYDDFINQYVNTNKVLDAVNSGLLDPLLNKTAQQMASAGTDIYLRLFHEPYWWFPWGMTSSEDVSKFKSAWEHIGKIFEDNNAKNVHFIMVLEVAQNSGFSEVLAIPSKYVSVIELDGYTDPNFRKNAQLSANELFTRKLSEISWQLERLYPNAATRPTIALGEFAFSGSDTMSKQDVYTYFINDLMHSAYSINRFSLLYTYQAGPRPTSSSLNYSPVQEGYWSATWQPQDPWYSNLLAQLDQKIGLWEDK